MSDDFYDRALFKKQLNIRAIYENETVKCWDAYTVPSKSDFIHTLKAEYEVTEVHWVQDNRPHVERLDIPVNLSLRLIQLKENSITPPTEEKT